MTTNNYKDLTGKKFNHLTAIKPLFEKSNRGEMIWLFKCDCGNYHKSVEGGVIKILFKNLLKMLVGVKDGYKKKNKR